MKSLLKYLFESVQTEENIEQVKRKILNLAMKGYLTPQKNDYLSMNGLFNKSSTNNLHERSESWEQIELGQIIRVINGRAYKKHELLEEGKYPVLRVGNLFTNNKWYYSNLELNKDKYCEEGDLIYAWSASFGPEIWQGAKSIYHYHIWKMEITRNDVFRDYVYRFLEWDTLEIKNQGHGIAMKHMTKTKMEKRVVFLPPYEEQKLISNEIDKLFAICDELAKQIVQEKEASAILNKTVFTSFQSESSEEADQALRFAIAHMDELLQSPEDIDLIKEAVLSLATRGKLVLQKFEEEPAFKLLEHIEEEKKHLIANKKMKKQAIKDLGDYCYKKEYLPKGWEVIRAGKIIQLLSGRDLSSADCNEKGMGIPYIMGASNIDMKKNELVIERWVENPTVIGKEGDLLLSVKGTVGKLIIQKLEEAHLSRQIMGIRAIGDLNIDYLKIYFEAHIKSIRKHSQGLIPGISREHILNTIIYLPPLEEQQRIVNKVQSLFQIFDNLNEQLLKRQNAKKSLSLKTL